MTALTLDQEAQERALLAAILAEPGEDAHRLIYADWLQDHGQEERAEFIRVQVELATLPDPQGVMHLSDRLRVNALGQREHNLLVRVGGSWCFPGANTKGWYTEGQTIEIVEDAFSVECTFQRGLISLVRCPLAAWEEHGPALCARHPVERVEVTDAHFVSATPTGLRNLGLPSTANLAVQIHFRPWPPAIWQTLIAVALDMPKGRSIVVGDPDRPGVERSRNILFCTMGDMHDCVSVACLIHARDQAAARGLLP